MRAPRRPAGDGRAVPAHAARRGGARASRGATRGARDRTRLGGFEVARRGGRPGPTTSTGSRTSRTRSSTSRTAAGSSALVEMDERVVRASSAAASPSSTQLRSRQRSAAAATRRLRPPLPRQPRAGPRAGARGAARGRPAAAHGARDHVAAGALRLRRRHCRPRDGLCQRHRQSGIQVGTPRRPRRRRHPRGPRQGDRPRSLACARQGVMSSRRRHVRGGHAAAGAAAARHRHERGSRPRRARRGGRRRRHPQRPAARARASQSPSGERRRRPSCASVCSRSRHLEPVFEAVQAVASRSRASTSSAAPSATSSWASRLRPGHRRRGGRASRSAGRSRARSAAAPCRTRSSARRS